MRVRVTPPIGQSPFSAKVVKKEERNSSCFGFTAFRAINQFDVKDKGFPQKLRMKTAPDAHPTPMQLSPIATAVGRYSGGSHSTLLPSQVIHVPSLPIPHPIQWA
jgi:hypothetical protein